MGAAEFFVELIRAYAEFLAAIAWPLVILIIFGAVLFYIDRSFGVVFRKRRMALNWRAYENVINQLESGYIEGLGQSKKDHPRKRLVQQQIDRARDAIQSRDSKKALRTLAALSSLGIQSDSQVAQWKLSDEPAEMLPPGD